MHTKFLLALYLGVLLLPLSLSYLSGQPPRSVRDELASGAGMLAFTIILVEFVLSGRFRTVSKHIGMDVTMRFHQVIARTALVLAVLHPLLYSAPFNAPYPWDPTRELTLYVDSRGLVTGVMAWVLLVVLVALSIGRSQLPYRYETWRLMHGLGALLIAGFAFDHTLTAGRYSQNAPLVVAWTLLFAGAVLSLAYVYAIKPVLQKRHPWTVRGVRPLADRTWELTLAPDGHRGLRYEAGQFVWLNVGHSPFSLSDNPFSISSAPSSGSAVTFVIKELGDFTRTLGRIEPGERAYLDGPFGNLTVSGRSEPGVALIAGGVGVAPLLGILRELRQTEGDRPVTLVYANRSQEQITYRDELAEHAQDPHTEVVHVLSEPPSGWGGRRGFVDAEVVRDLFDTPARRQWLFLICGPPPMIEDVERALLAIGVPAQQILSERFQYD